MAPSTVAAEGHSGVEIRTGNGGNDCQPSAPAERRPVVPSHAVAADSGNVRRLRLGRLQSRIRMVQIAGSPPNG
jgi:hypothetical protein